MEIDENPEYAKDIADCCKFIKNCCYFILIMLVGIFGLIAGFLCT